ncbi:hypothetical protein [Lacrimispora algidixylanolytica]|uniref:Uncharacterized protein n=1 Tax=Lacrimispora algidixylanolytica TaxID=94868 RepID=A0A419SW10_9FIRM|nr:hypothetical protein [Lacrimispora algidixylanolytica]RKD29401.1 hypothetical protein BET01_08635 [Lacrimispora algidixylanolytica]
MNMEKRQKFNKFRNKTKKDIRVLIVVSLGILSLCSCNSNNKTISKEYMDKVELLNQGGVPTLQEVKYLDTEYYNLTPKQKELVTNYGTIKKYLNLDLDSIHSIQSAIDNGIAQNKISYKEVSDIEERYNKLSSDEKNYVLNIDQLGKYKELNEYDKASIVAIRYLKQILKNSESIKVSELNGKKDGEWYFIKIKYSATNDFGGRKDDEACLDVSSEFKIGVISFFIENNDFKETSDSFLIGYKNDIKSSEVSIDSDKVLDNINKEF